eukprot:INCI15429.2.p1 GENE.INCI15429.2~~INCI15429.2.p1  ORF type:complete len:1175 (+),score=212.74 INCI15429.2:182-3706(+)
MSKAAVVPGGLGVAATSENVLFKEVDEVRDLVQLLVSMDAAAVDIDDAEALRACDKLCSIFDQYQEQAQLLDKHLEGIVTPVMSRARELIAQQVAGPQSDADEAASFPVQAFSSRLFDVLMKIIYFLCKVRGYKTVVQLLPHEVHDVEPVLKVLQGQDPQDHDRWPTRYSLLLWLSILARVPFDLTTIDSSAGTGSEDSLATSIIALCRSYLSDSGLAMKGASVCLAQLLTRPDMESRHIGEFFEWANEILEQGATGGSDTFQVTGVLLSLVEMFKHGNRSQLLEHVDIIFDSTLDLVDTVGASSSLLRKLLMKLTQRIGLQFLPPKIPTWRYQRGHRSLLVNLQKQQEGAQQAQEQDAAGGVVAQAQSEGDASSRPDGTAEVDVAAEEVEIAAEIEDVIDLLLCGLRDSDTIVRWSAAKGLGRITLRLPTKVLADVVVGSILELFTDGEGDSAWHGGCLALAELARRGLLLPARLGDVIPKVLTALQYDKRRGAHSVGMHVRDAACYVCWAFARAYAPDIMSPFVLDLSRGMLKTALCDREVNCRRAASAAFQENVGRQGAQNFKHGIEILTAADYFTLGPRQNAYLVVAPFVAKFPLYRFSVIDHIAQIKLYHWDEALRHLSSKALHELTSLDVAYMQNSVLPVLLEDTLSEQLNVRHGATLGIAEIVLAAAKIPATLSELVLRKVRNLTMRIEKKRLYRGRGGTTMRECVAHLIYAIAEAAHPLSEAAIFRLLKSIYDHLQQPRTETQAAAIAAFRSFSRQYFSTLTQAQVETKVLQPLFAMLHNDNPAARSGGALGLGALPKFILCPHGNGSDGGATSRLDNVLDMLIEETKVKSDPVLRHPESQRDAVLGLQGVLIEVQAGPLGLSAAQGHRVLQCLLDCLEDYTATDRGDVGSFSRRAALDTVWHLFKVLNLQVASVANEKPTADTPFGPGVILQKFAQGTMFRISFEAPTLGSFHFPYGVGALAASLVNPAPLHARSAPQESAETVAFWTRDMAHEVVGAVLKQASEKIDGLREVAGRVLENILFAEFEAVAEIPEHEKLRAIFGPCGSLQWNAADETFPKLSQVLSVDAFRPFVIRGMSLSVASKNAQSLVKAASTGFSAWVQRQQQRKADESMSQSAVANLESLATTLLEVLESNASVSRVVVPTFQVRRAGSCVARRSTTLPFV